MVVAVAKALEAGARALICASTGNTSASAAAYGAAAGLEVVVVLPARPDRRSASCSRPWSPGRGSSRSTATSTQALRGRPRAGRAGRPPGHPRQLGQPVPPRGPEDGRLRGLRRPGPGARRPGDPGRQRRQHQRLLGRLPRLPGGRARSTGSPADVRLPGRRRRPDRARPPDRRTPRRSRPPSGSATRRSWTKAIAARDESGGADRVGHRRRDPGRLPRPGPARGHLLRAVVGGQPSPACQAAGGRGRLDARRYDRVRADRPRPEGSRRPPRRSVAGLSSRPTRPPAPSPRALGW